MDLAHRDQLASRLLALSGRVRELPQALLARARRRRLPDRALRTLTGVLLLGAALVLASWARDVAQETALAQWKRVHFPSTVVWAHALGAREFEEIRSDSLARQALRALPPRFDSQGLVWLSGDSRWIIVFPGSGDSAPRMYRLSDQAEGRAKLPAGWELQGNGWDAFDAALARIDEMKAKLAAQKRPPARKKAPSVDPRAILY